MAAPGASEMVVVVTGGDAVDPAHLDGRHRRRLRDRGRLRHRPRAGPRVCGSTSPSATSTRSTPAALATADGHGHPVERHPAAKDATDLELALDAAISRRPGRIHVLGGHGGRLDHLLANALVLAAPA